MVLITNNTFPCPFVFHIIHITNRYQVSGRIRYRYRYQQYNSDIVSGNIIPFYSFFYYLEYLYYILSRLIFCIITILKSSPLFTTQIKTYICIPLAMTPTKDHTSVQGGADSIYFIKVCHGLYYSREGISNILLT